jgi:hypothetical protein
VATTVAQKPNTVKTICWAERACRSFDASAKVLMTIPLQKSNKVQVRECFKKIYVCLTRITHLWKSRRLGSQVCKTSGLITLLLLTPPWTHGVVHWARPAWLCPLIDKYQPQSLEKVKREREDQSHVMLTCSPQGIKSWGLAATISTLLESALKTKT